MIGYDLDGVLAEKPPKSEVSWGKMNGDARAGRKDFLVDFYMNAKPILHPEGEFIVVTARKQEPKVVDATMRWFQKHYPNPPQVFFLNTSRTIVNVIAFKASVLKQFKVIEYYEDNKIVLRGLKEQHPNCTYFFVNKKGGIEDF